MRIPALLLVFAVGIGRSFASNAPPTPEWIVYAENPDGTVDAVYDCSVLNEQKAHHATSLWGSAYPDNLRSLTIANCKNLLLDIGVHGNGKKNLTRLTVDNVDRCIVTADERPEDAGHRTGLPQDTCFQNVNSLSVEVPLFRDSPTAAHHGVLQFDNVTVRRLSADAVRLRAFPMKKFVMRGVSIAGAEEGAISFSGTASSVLEIENSVFTSAPKNFIQCRVTDVKISQNRFSNLESQSFSLDARNFVFVGNAVEEVKVYPFAITATNASIRDNTFRLAREGSASGTTTRSHRDFLRLMENREEEILRSRDSSEAGDDVPAEAAAGSDDGGRRFFRGNYGPEKALEYHFSSNLLPIWFLALFALILLFPIAYFARNSLCRAVDRAFPPEVRHQRLKEETGA